MCQALLLGWSLLALGLDYYGLYMMGMLDKRYICLYFCLSGGVISLFSGMLPT